MSMKVGFDLTWMSVRNSSDGVFQYAERLVSALVKHSDISIFAMVLEHVGDTFEHLSGLGHEVIEFFRRRGIIFYPEKMKRSIS